MIEPGRFPPRPAAEHVAVEPKTLLGRSAPGGLAGAASGGQNDSAIPELGALDGGLESRDAAAAMAGGVSWHSSGGEGERPMDRDSAVSTAERREFLASPLSAAEARRFVDSTGRRWGLPAGVIDDAVLIVSEMITNSIAAAPYERIGVQLLRVMGALAIEVWDPSPHLPRRRVPEIEPTGDGDPGERTPGGWGLGIIEALAMRSGHRSEGGGKIVFALLAIEA